MVRCHFDSDGAWLVFQRNLDAKTNFQVGWQSYKHGFGDPQGSYWLGNEIVHKISIKTQQKIKIILKSFDGDVKEWIYAKFHIESESANYTLRAKSRITGGSDILNDAKGREFTTLGFDNDVSSYINCAEELNRGGFWYGNCGSFTPNALWVNASNLNRGDKSGIRYSRWKQNQILKSTEMMIRDP
ncbi:ficolin-2-like [Clytia hemisphaerica]|uniref:ficolin-2-like n=1 Tax=Clytia hemisphaerica TaxID=252671 RepID=UPI0034D4445D